MGPPAMGLGHVWPFVLAYKGRGWQTHAWGCCWQVWALRRALGCIPPARFGMFGPPCNGSAHLAMDQLGPMGPMGLGHVWPFVLAPGGLGWQTHAWGCCQHVWALCHALSCTLPACFGMPTVFGPHLGLLTPPVQRFEKCNEVQFSAN